MLTKTFLAAAVAVSFLAIPAMAQNADHHYEGGPKTPVPHHVGKKDASDIGKKATSGSTAKKGKSGSHHYSGGPRTDPHHIGPK